MRATLQSVGRIVRTAPQASGRLERVDLDLITVLVVGSFFLVTAAVLTGKGLAVVAALVALVMTTSVWHQTLLRWSTILGALLAVILFVPIGRYTLPVNLPFGVELYRVFVLLVIAVWVASLLIDPSVQLRRSPFDLAVAIVVGATVGSVIVNRSRVAPLDAAVLKELTFFLSFVAVYYFIVSVVRRQQTIESVTKLLVGGVAVVALFAMVEQRTRFNVFDHVSLALPFLEFSGPVEDERYGLVRAVASAEHPIALGVLFAMTIPLGLALALGSSRKWWLATGMVAVGLASTGSRTPILVLVAASLVLLWLRPRELKGLLPLIVPLIVVTKLLLPGSLATLKEAFVPQGGIVAEQAVLARNADPLLAGGRIRQFRPMLNEAARTPLLGQGFGTRQTGFNNPLRNAPILDNQWLGLLLEVGIVGLVGWVVLVFGSALSLGRASRRRAGPSGWLEVGMSASIVGFGVGMFTYDSLAFTQVALVFWIVLALSASLVLASTESQ